MPKFRQIYPVVLEKKFILLFLLFLVTAAILDFQPDPILQFWDPGVRSCSMWNLRTMGPVVLQKKMFEYLFLGVDGHIVWRRTTHDARRTHWYDNSSLWPFGPGELKTYGSCCMFVKYMLHHIRSIFQLSNGAKWSRGKHEFPYAAKRAWKYGQTDRRTDGQVLQTDNAQTMYVCINSHHKRFFSLWEMEHKCNGWMQILLPSTDTLTVGQDQ